MVVMSVRGEDGCQSQEIFVSLFALVSQRVSQRERNDVHSKKCTPQIERESENEHENRSWS